MFLVGIEYQRRQNKAERRKALRFVFAKNINLFLKV